MKIEEVVVENKNVTVTSDRCKKQVEGVMGEGSAGFYCVGKGDDFSLCWWGRFSDPGEQIICDACMWADPRYIAVYGVVGNVTEQKAT